MNIKNRRRVRKKKIIPGTWYFVICTFQFIIEIR